MTEFEEPAPRVRPFAKPPAEPPLITTSGVPAKSGWVCPLMSTGSVICGKGPKPAVPGVIVSSFEGRSNAMVLEGPPLASI